MPNIQQLSLVLLSIAIVACQQGREEPAHLDKNLTVFYLQGTPEVRSFVDSCVAKYSIRFGGKALSKPCTVLELLSLAANTNRKDSASLFILPYEYIPAVAALGSVMVLPDVLSDDYAPLGNVCHWQGKRVAIPLTCDIAMLLLSGPIASSSGSSAAGLDTDQMFALQDTFSSRYKATWTSAGDDPRSSAQTIASWLGDHGGCIIDDSGNVVVNSAMNKQALTAYADLAKGRELETRRQQRASFAQGNLAMLYGNSSYLPLLRKQKPSTAFSATYVNPHARGSSTPLLHGYGVCVSGTFPDTDPMYAYLTDLRHVVKQHESLGFPTFSSYWHNTLRSSDSSMQLIAKRMRIARPMHSHPQWPTIVILLERAVLDALYGNQSVEDVLDGLQEDIEGLIS
ncbi:MAG: hypothetical protein FJ211_05035 [Ignavibacteria bacterium]|nr:hypothetical protein [Ignavibacteria bacterium]